MTPEALLARPEHREVFAEWKEGVLTFGEAVFIAQRSAVGWKLQLFGVPDFFIRFVLFGYDLLYE